MDIIRYILFAQVFLAFFISGGVFFKDRTLRSTTLSLLIALMGFHIFLFLFGSSKLMQWYPQFQSWFYYEVALLFGPLLFIHLQCLIYNKTKLKPIDALHLVSIFIFWLGYGDVLLMPGIERSAYVDANFINRTMLWNYGLVFQMIFYALVCSCFLFLKRILLSHRKKYYALFLVISYVGSVILISYLTHYASGWRAFALYYLILTVLIFGIGYLLFRNPDFLKQIRKKYFASNLDDDYMLKIKSKIEAVFSKNQLFLDSNLTIVDLAEKLKEKPHHVSQTFSECINENFNDYVNKHRINIAKKRLHDSEYSHYKIEAIALETGFNNKVTFYKAFTKFTKTTPSAFRKQK